MRERAGCRVSPHGTCGRAPVGLRRTPNNLMPLLTVVLTLIVVGVLLWLANTYIPMAGSIKTILNIFVVVAVILWLLFGFGILSRSGNISMPN